MNFLITGGASGLGNAITRTIALNHPSSIVYFTYHHSVEKAKELESIFVNSRAIHCDFTKSADVVNLCDLISNNEIGVLVNNAVTRIDKNHFHKTSSNVFTEGFITDIVSTLEITKAFIAKARKNKLGRIITILSAALLNTPPAGWSTYVANKAYLLSMHKSWATENNGFNITSNCISPDFMATALNKEVDERIVENMIAKHPLKRLLTIEEVAETVLFLCNASPHLNGQNIVLNAAQTL